ncbi:MAG: ATP F0F1 synthase subunit B' [Hyphomicrobiales bacterium]|nr:MAG: ATP F0F1 synthase subunit B' [Hyphomicrobiales bacterium]
MPQLDFALWPPQLIWLLICFTALYVIMVRVALPRISTVIEQRRDRIAGDLDQARELRDKSEKARADYEEALQEARARAHSIAQETRDKLNALTERQRAMGEATLTSKLADAEARIAESKNQAMAKLDDIAAETATALIGKLIGSGVSEAKVNKAVKALHQSGGDADG